MSASEWSLEKRLLVELRKSAKVRPGAWRVRATTDMVTLSPAPIVGLPLQPGETVVGEVTNRTGRRFRLGTNAIFIESAPQWVRVPYHSIMACHCMAEMTDIPEDPYLRSFYYRSLKKTYGDRIILVDRWETRYDLDKVGRAYFGLYRFFCVVAANGRRASRSRIFVQ